jgi:site-specific DNA recombinase
MKAILYTRCSTVEQRTRGNSHEGQIYELRKSLENRNIAEAAVYSDTISGREFNRLNLDKLYQECLSDPAMTNFVFIHRWDRFGRNVSEALTWIKRFKTVNIELNCPDQWIDYHDPNYIIILGFHLTVAEAESNKISQRTRTGLSSLAREGFYTKPQTPTGYTKIMIFVASKKRRVLQPNDLAPIINNSFQLIADGMPLTDCWIKSKTLLNLSRDSFVRMLRNPIYAGWISLPIDNNMPELIKGKHQAIVSDYLFQKVNLCLDKLSLKNGKPFRQISTDRSQFFFIKGLLMDLNSGYKYTAYYSTGRHSVEYTYYELKSKKIIHRADTLHDIVTDAVSQLALPNNLANELKDAHLKEQAIIHKELSLVKDALTKVGVQIKKVESDYLDEKISAASFNRLSRQLSEKHTSLALEKEKLSSELRKDTFSVSDEILQKINVSGLFKMASPPLKYELLKIIFPSGFDIFPTDQILKTPEIHHIFRHCPPPQKTGVTIKISGSKTRVMGASHNNVRTLIESLQSLQFIYNTLTA